MKESIIVGLVVVMFCLGFVSCQHQKSQTLKWEYQIVRFDTNQQPQLTQMGKDGWELVSIHVQRSNGSDLGAIGYFKRPLDQ